MTKVNIITTTLPKTYGGRTKSLLQRALLLNKANVDVRLVTTNYRENYQAIYNEYYKKKKVLANTTFHNIYDYYAGLLHSSELVEWRQLLSQQVGALSDYILVKRSENFGRDYYYKDGKPSFMIKYHEPNRVHYFALFTDTHFEPVKFFFVNEQGYVHKIDTKNDALIVVKQDFIANGHDVYVTRYVDERNRATKIELVTPSEQVAFNNEKEFFAYYYAEIFTDENVVISDARALDVPLLNTSVKKRIFQLHNPHMVDPLDNRSAMKGSFRPILTPKLTDKDFVVTLTEQQKADILQKVPTIENNIVVISHSTTPRKIQYERIGKHFVMVLRLHPQKNIKDAIEAFSIFNQTNPGYTFDIYGEGELQQVLQRQIEQLGLTEQVILHGRTDDVDKAYQQADALIVTSHFEGFALNVLEAVSNGTPVITYPINYGPTDIIDETSGYVAETRTPQALADKMQEFVKSPKSTEAVLERSKQFSEANFVRKWLEIIQ